MTVQAFIKDKFWSELINLVEEFPNFDTLGEYFVGVDGDPYSAPGGGRIDMFEYYEDFGFDDREEFEIYLSDGEGISNVEVYILDPPNETSDKRLEITFITPSKSEIELCFDLKKEYTESFYRLQYLIELWFELDKTMEQLLKIE